MTLYAVLLHATNLKLEAKDGRLVAGGMYTWRVVEADDQDTALEIAAARILMDAHFNSEIWNDPGDPPRITFDEVRAYPPGTTAEEDSGLVFYSEEE